MASRSIDTNRLEAAFQILKEEGLFKSGTYVDIGANIGHTSVHFWEIFDKFICFEPNHEAFKILEFEFELLKSQQNVQYILHNTAISNQNNKTVLSVPDGNLGWGSMDNRRRKQFKDAPFYVDLVEYEIEAKTLDSFDLKNVAFIKVDTEQHEDKVCEGMLKTLEKNDYPPVFLENKRNEASKGIELLMTLGYSRIRVKKFKSDKHNILLAKT